MQSGLGAIVLAALVYPTSSGDAHGGARCVRTRRFVASCPPKRQYRKRRARKNLRGTQDRTASVGHEAE